MMVEELSYTQRPIDCWWLVHRGHGWQAMAMEAGELYKCGPCRPTVQAAEADGAGSGLPRAGDLCRPS